MEEQRKLGLIPRKMPIGIQSFEKLRREEYVYVDKTELIYQLASMSTPYFLSRPRRFGKSLLLSTLEAYFLGKRELFNGLAMERLETEWATHAVLHLDLNAERYDTVENLQQSLEGQLVEWENQYGREDYAKTCSQRFLGIIKSACKQTGRGVVVLIDEYDKPLLNNLHDEALQEKFRDILRAFYSVLKTADPWLRFVFITGVTKFAQVGVFSTLNQLLDISFDLGYSTLCGLTLQEIEAYFKPELQFLGKANRQTYEETLARLTQMYDGYHFTWGDVPGMYNPFSVLNVMRSFRYENYWFATGTPTFLVEMLEKTDYDLRELEGMQVIAESLSDDRADVDNPIPMMYQSGYLTIKGYNESRRWYTLGFPNDEVRYGFWNFIVPFYTSVSSTKASFYIGKFDDELEAGDVDAFLTRLRSFFGSIPYELNDRTECHYQTIFHIVFTLLGQYTESEVHSAKGRADTVVKTKSFIYIFEFKLFETAENALRQIDEKGYALPYTHDGRRIIKVGVEFSTEERNISRWLIAED